MEFLGEKAPKGTKCHMVGLQFGEEQSWRGMSGTRQHGKTACIASNFPTIDGAPSPHARTKKAPNLFA